MAERVLISLGSNIDRQRNLPAAVTALDRHPDIRLVAVSPIYATQPVGGNADDPIFYNAAALVETDLPVAELRQALRAIEAGLGRVRADDKFAPRPIDLDIAMVGERVMEVDGYVIPDPEIVRYPHLALPLADVAPAWVHPRHGLTLRQLAAQMTYSEDEIYRVT